MMEKEIRVGTILSYEEFKGIRIDVEEIWKSIDPTSARVEYIPMYISLLQEKKKELSGKPIAIGGRAPIWLYCVILHELHGISPLVCVEDPKVGGYIVIYAHVTASEILRKAETEAKAFIKRSTFINVDGVREITLELYKKMVEILETQKEMYKEYLSLKKKQVELLEQASDRDRTRYD